jgi:sugar/nucleoside kinase (ribokinase family)
MRVERSWEDIVPGYSSVMLDGYYLPQAIELAKEAHKANLSVVLDGGSWKTGLEELLPLITDCICSADFYPPGCTDHNSIIEYLHDVGVPNVAISRGGDPLVYSSHGQSGLIDIKEQEIVDTLGAGDILHGVFCACLPDMGFYESLRYASEVATLSCRYRGTRLWIDQYMKRQ